MATRNRPKKGERYKHYKGSTYVVLCISTCVETGIEYVVYEAESSGMMYHRTVERFMSSVPENNQLRFEQIW